MAVSKLHAGVISIETSLTRRPGDSSSCLTLNSTDGDFFSTNDLGGVEVFPLLLTIIGAGAAYDGPAEREFSLSVGAKVRDGRFSAGRQSLAWRKIREKLQRKKIGGGKASRAVTSRGKQVPESSRFSAN